MISKQIQMMCHKNSVGEIITASYVDNNNDHTLTLSVEKDHVVESSTQSRWALFLNQYFLNHWQNSAIKGIDVDSDGNEWILLIQIASLTGSRL